MLVVLAGGVLAGGCGGGSGGGGGAAQAVQVGVDWARAADGDGALFASPGEDVYVTDVCAGGPGLVAVGYRVAYDPSYRKRYYSHWHNAFPCTLEVWTSEDGREWARLGDEAFVDEASRRLEQEYQRESLWDDFGNAEPRIVSGPGGLLLTCGLHIFKSPDGLRWSEVKGVAAFDGTTIEVNTASGRRPCDYAASFFMDVLPTGSGYVASMSADTHLHGSQGWMPGPSVWASPDGADWSLVPLEYVDLFGLENLSALAAGGPGIVAVGRELNAARAWTASPDASAWAPSPGVLAERAEPFGLAAGGPGLVAVGKLGRFEAGDLSVTGAVWTSVDGTAWTAASGEASQLADAELSAVTAWASGLTAAGTVYLKETAPDRPILNYSGGAVWNSPDGASWTRVLLPRADEGSRSVEAAKGVASFAGGLVVVGCEEAGGQPARGVIWTSLDR